MKKTIWTFGLISGGILSVMMLLTLPFHDRIGFERALVIGYATMVAAFMLIFFGVKSYRDSVGGGAVGFGRALAVGVLIACVASACYVVTWEALYYTTDIGSEYLPKYQAHYIEKERAKGTAQDAIDKEVTEMKEFAEMYKNPAINAAVTFVEPLPVGLLIALVSAGLLRRKKAAA